MSETLVDGVLTVRQRSEVGGDSLAFDLYDTREGADESKNVPAPTVHVDSSAVLSSWRPAERRVFLFVSPTCPYCNRSMDFYARLGRVADSVQRAGRSVALVAVVSRSVSSRSQRKILRDADVSVDTLASLPPDTLRSMDVTSVPTVAVEQPGRERPAVWVGLQDSTGEQEILSAIRALEAVQ